MDKPLRKFIDIIHNLNEEPVNNVGGGQIAGTNEAGDKPPVNKKKRNEMKKRKEKKRKTYKKLVQTTKKQHTHTHTTLKKKVASGVKAICVPGSSQVKLEAEREGLDQIFKAAGFEWRESGCSMCFFAGGESFGEKQRVITTTNRNFENRQGKHTRSHLASPATVAASAVSGKLNDVKSLEIE